MDSRYGTTNAPKNVSDTGSVKENVNYSVFNYSAMKSCQGIFGAIMPIDLIEVIPNETVSIQNNLMVAPRLPLVRKLKNGVNVRMNYFYMRKKDLWDKWEAWYDGGVNGKGDSSIIYPKLSYMHKVETDWGDEADTYAAATNRTWACDTKEMWVTSLTPMSPYAYMGGECQLANFQKFDGTNANTERPHIEAFKEMIVKHGSHDYNPTASSDPKYLKAKKSPTGDADFYLERNWECWNGDRGNKLEIDALRFVMYCRVCRDIYFNTALLQDNKLWYPDVEWEFKLRQTSLTNNGNPTNGYVNVVNFDCGTIESTSGIWHCDGGPAPKHYIPTNYYNAANKWTSVFNTAPFLNMLYFRQWDADYFTSASPFEDLMKTANFWNGIVEKGADVDGYVDAITDTYVNTSHNLAVNSDAPNSGELMANTVSASDLKNILKNNMKTKSHIDMNEVRNMLACNKMLQLVGTINTPNVYNTFIAKTYSTDPKNDNGKPTFIGGYNGGMMFTDVVNATDNGTMPQGTKVSNGILAVSENVGQFKVPDHGYIMGLLTIDVDTMYRGGLTKDWSRKTQMDYANPMFEGVSSAPINYGELKIPYYPTNSDDKDIVWGHTCMNEDYKSRQNRACGFNQFPNMFKWDNSQYLCKTFTGVESNDRFNNTNITMSPNNCDLSLIFNAPNEPTFDIDLQSNIKRSMPLVAKAMPKILH